VVHAFLLYSQQLGHSHSCQSGGTRPVTLQSTVGTLTLQPIRWGAPFYATVNSWDTHIPANQVGHALLRYSQQLGHSHCSQSGGVRPFTLQPTAGTLKLQPIRLGAPFYATVNRWDTQTPANQVGCALLRYSQQMGHSNSSLSGWVRPFTLQLTDGTLKLQPIRLGAPFYATVKRWDTHTPANQVGYARLRYSQQLGHSHSSQSGGVRPIMLKPTVGQLGHSHSSQSGGYSWDTHTPHNRVEHVLLRYSNSWGRLHSIQSGRTRLADQV
jgi:hypothetical protein